MTWLEKAMDQDRTLPGVIPLYAATVFARHRNPGGYDSLQQAIPVFEQYLTDELAKSPADESKVRNAIIYLDRIHEKLDDQQKKRLG